MTSRRLRLLVEDLPNHYGVGIDPIHETPIVPRIYDSELVASATDRRHCSRVKDSPFCSLLNKIPTSRRASFENGGVFTSPCSHTSGLSFTATFFRIQDSYVRSDMHGQAAVDRFRAAAPWHKHVPARVERISPD